MNVIIVNKRKELNNLNIDVLKSLDGEFDVEELIGMFTNFFFNKMIIDISAIRDYNNMSKMKKLADAIDMSKVIILLGDTSSETSKEFLSDLVSLGIYNFTNTFNEVMNLFNNPNTYEDVKKYHFDTSFSAGLNDDTPKEIEEFDEVEEFSEGLRIIGVQNLTDGAGSTTLTVQMVKQLNLKYKAIGIEMNKQDFIFFTVPYLYSCTSRADAVKKINEHTDCQIVVVDLNRFEQNDFCNDIIYLVEPSTIKLTKLLKKNKVAFNEVLGSKIVLNKSNISKKDVSSFEVELGTKIFAVVDNFNDRLEEVSTVNDLLTSLGFVEHNEDEEVVVEKKRFRFFK